MGIFSTPRTPNPDEALEREIALKKRRRENMMSLDNSNEGKYLQSALESMDAGINEELKADMDRYAEKERVLKSRAKQKMVTLESRLIEEGFDIMYDATIFEMVYNSYWMDDSVKEGKIQEMFEHFKNFTDDFDSMGVTESVGQDSIFIKNLKECVMETCKKAAKRITEENEGKCDTPEDVDSISFDINGDEQEELDSNLAELGKTDIEELVKQKVLKVVQDEQEAGQQKAEMFADLDQAEKDLNQEANDMAADPEAEGTSESLQFKQLMVSRKKAKLNNLVGASVFDALMIKNNKMISESIATEGVSVDGRVKMDSVLSNTILDYTILETMMTVGLCKFSPSTAKSIINSCVELSR